MKKILVSALAGICVLGLASCNKEEKPNKPEEKRTRIEYLGWDLGTEEKPTLKSVLIDKFNETNKEIIIDKIYPQGNYNEFLNTLASSNALPDVYLTESVPANIISKQALDLTSLVNGDNEWNNVVNDLKEVVTYNDKVYAIPSAQNYMGFFANYSLLDEYATWESKEDAVDRFAPGKFTTEQFFDAVKNTKKLNEDGSSVIGISSTGDMINWLPSSLDKTNKTKHFVWNGEKFDLLGEPMLDAITKIQELGNKQNQYTYTSFGTNVAPDAAEGTLSEVKKYFGNDNYEVAFQNGQVAFLQAASWNVFTDINADIDYKFIGYPDKKVVSAADFLCLSSATENKEAAFEVAKFLSYGVQGIETRLNIVQNAAPEEGLALGGLPIVTTKELNNKWFENLTMPGFKEVHELVSKGEMQLLVEGNKVVPGYKEARFDYDTGIVIEGVRDGKPLKIGDFIWDVCEGLISKNDYLTNLTTNKLNAINKIIEDNMNKIKNV